MEYYSIKRLSRLKEKKDLGCFGSWFEEKKKEINLVFIY